MTAKLGSRYRNGSTLYRGKAQRDATPSGWRAKLAYADKASIGTVLTAVDVHELTLLLGMREAGR